MRVLYLTVWFPHPADNGSKLRVYYLLRALCEKHDVTLVSYAFGTSPPLDYGPLREWCKRIEVVEVDHFAVNQSRRTADIRLVPPHGFTPDCSDRASSSKTRIRD